jgi:hypothetical protein
MAARGGTGVAGTEAEPNPMAHFKRFVDSRAFLVGTSIAVVGAVIFHALTSLPFWACFPMVVVAVLLNSWLAEWEDNQPGGFNNPNSDR